MASVIARSGRVVGDALPPLADQAGAGGRRRRRSIPPSSTSTPGPLESDIAALVRDVATSMSLRRDDISEDVAVALSRNPEFRAAINEKFVAPRLAVLGQVLERARDRGELGNGEPVAASPPRPPPAS